MNSRFVAYENIPHGWEIMDASDMPVRTFVVGLTEAQARTVALELNKLADQLAYTRSVLWSKS